MLLDYLMNSQTHATIENTKENLVFYYFLPFFKKEDLDVKFENSILTVEAKYTGDKNFIYQSFSSNIKESFKIKNQIKDIDASFENNILKITLIKELKENKILIK